MNGFDPLNPSLPVGDWIADGISWLQDALGTFFDVIQVILNGMYHGLTTALQTPLYLIMIVIFAGIAWAAASWKLAIFSVLGFYLIRAMDLWAHAMETIALVIVAVFIALLFAIPLGIVASKVQVVSRIVRPILDFMQTMPAMVYLVPAITIFGVGVVPGAVATLIFAMPPGVRLTELALRQVDGELVEAGQSFGATPARILWQVQLPVALPTIMAGINQVIMLALSMVVLAGMAGADGLGGDVVGSLAQLNVPLGMSAGLAVVIIAIWLDRVSNGLGTQRERARARAARRRPGTATAGDDSTSTGSTHTDSTPTDSTHTDSTHTDSTPATA